MDSTLMYLSLFGGMFAVLLARRLFVLFTQHVLPRLRVAFARHIQYPWLVPRRHWTGVTRLEASILLVYFLINALALGVPVSGSVDLQRRAARTAIINLTPVFLGGRTNPLVDFIGIPISTYYVAHHWIGRVAVVEALLHPSIILIRRLPVKGLGASGYTVGITLVFAQSCD